MSDDLVALLRENSTRLLSIPTAGVVLTASYYELFKESAHAMWKAAAALESANAATQKGLSSPNGQVGTPRDLSLPSALAAPDGPAGRDDPTPIESASLTAAPVPAVPSPREATLPDAAGERERLYEELLFAVGNKYPNETRHQTALRYIRQAEEPHGAADAAMTAEGSKP